MKMKDKKAEQIANKERHQESLKAGRRAQPSLQRTEPSKTEKPTILIVCEGENTEPSYFNLFRLSSATIKAIGEGYNTVTLVERALELSNRKQYDQVWCVFDKDDFSENDFNNAIQKAETNNLQVAYSNQAFEYWIILHFEDHQGGGMHRNNYNNKINRLLKPFNLEYQGEGNKIITEEIFEILKSRETGRKIERYRLAIKRAEKIYKQSNVNPAKAESSTTVFKLVKELIKYL